MEIKIYTYFQDSLIVLTFNMHPDINCTSLNNVFIFFLTQKFKKCYSTKHYLEKLYYIVFSTTKKILISLVEKSN